MKLADSLLQAFLEQMLQEGVFHADPHPGNVMLLADGRLALIDFGAVGRLDPVQQAALRDLMAGVSRRDADAVVQAVLQVASLRRGVDVNDFERALARFMAQHLAPGTQPDAAMFNAMLRLMFDYGITMPAEWSTFFRALIVLEGTLTTIAPGYSVIDAAESIAAKWVRNLINPNSVQQALRDELLRTVPMLRRLPRHVDRAFSNLERDGLRVRVTHFSDEHDERVVDRDSSTAWSSRSCPAPSASCPSASSRSTAARRSPTAPRSSASSGTSGSSARRCWRCGSSSRCCATASTRTAPPPPRQPGRLRHVTRSS